MTNSIGGSGINSAIDSGANSLDGNFSTVGKEQTILRAVPSTVWKVINGNTIQAYTATTMYTKYALELFLNTNFKAQQRVAVSGETGFQAHLITGFTAASWLDTFASHPGWDFAESGAGVKKFLYLQDFTPIGRFDSDDNLAEPVTYGDVFGAMSPVGNAVIIQRSLSYSQAVNGNWTTFDGWATTLNQTGELISVTKLDTPFVVDNQANQFLVFTLGRILVLSGEIYPPNYGYKLFQYDL